MRQGRLAPTSCTVAIKVQTLPFSLTFATIDNHASMQTCDNLHTCGTLGSWNRNHWHDSTHPEQFIASVGGPDLLLKCSPFARRPHGSRYGRTVHQPHQRHHPPSNRSKSHQSSPNIQYPTVSLAIRVHMKLASLSVPWVNCGESFDMFFLVVVSIVHPHGAYCRDVCRFGYRLQILVFRLDTGRGVLSY